MSKIVHNGVPVPSFIYGTAWKKQATARCVELAVAAGFRAIDTANQLIHYDEALVGQALRSLSERGVERRSLFLQTKFTPAAGQDHRTPYDPAAALTTQVEQSFESSLTHLKTDYVDCYLLHAPFGRRGLTDADWEVWAAMEKLQRSGKAKMIGISNVTALQLTELCARAEYKPMAVQNRCFAVMGWDMAVRQVCAKEGIMYQGFSLLTANRQVLAHPEVHRAAQRLRTGPAQVVFAFAVQIGMVPLTGTTSAQHMAEDLEAERLALTSDEVARIESIALAEQR